MIAVYLPRSNAITASAVVASIFFLALISPVRAQETSTYKEQGKLIRAPQNIVHLGTDLFGDKVNLYTGGLAFTQTDVSLPGNSKLPVSVGRRLTVGQEFQSNTLFGGWDLEIPHMHGVFAAQAGWKTALGSDRYARCSSYGPPPGATGSFGSNSSWNATEFWNGNFLYVPGAGDQELLRRNVSNTQAPTANPAYTFPVVTRDNWAIRCLPSMAPGNGEPGEGFVAVSPDGTEYRFDWLVTRPLPYLTKSNVGPENAKNGPVTTDSATKLGPETTSVGGGETVDSFDGNVLSRVEVWILPTQITDRFGNTVTYTYNQTNQWQLQSIVGNDIGGSPRTITLTYSTPGSLTSSLVTSVFDGTRTWNYTYSSATALLPLATVTLPDGSAWKELDSMTPLLVSLDYLGEGSCEEPGWLNPATPSGHMMHPSGARGEFWLTTTRHGRSGVDYSCGVNPYYQTYTPYYPKEFDTFALTKKEISGSGLPTMQWLTSYSPKESSWAPCNGCNATKQVEVFDPAGNMTRFTFGTLFRNTEGRLQQTDVFDSNGSVIRTTYEQYTDPIPPRGESDQRRGDGEMAARVSETSRRQISQQGVDFVWQADSFDPLIAKPARITRSSTLGMTRTETTVYNNNLAKWVLGQVESVTELSTGKLMVANVYNPATANLESVRKFGLLKQSMTYNPDGTLATRSDAGGHTTTFSNYKRGLAQNAVYPDNTTESASVNNIGNIDSTTDPYYYTTSYGYDAMGRLNRITHPTPDTVTWNDTTLTFGPVAGYEYGLGAGHWRQTIATGNARTVNYFDELWRPVLSRTYDIGDEGSTGKLVVRRFDHAGRTIFESYPQRALNSIYDSVSGKTTSFEPLGRISASSIGSDLGALTTSYSYLSGFQRSVTNPRGFTTTSAFFALDEPSEDAVTNIAAPEGVNVALARDIFGKTTAITRSGGGKSATRSYVYDVNELLCKTIEPETGATVQAYDLAGNIAWRASGLSLPSASCDIASVPAAKKIAFGYDPLNRLTTTTYSDGSPAIARTYTLDGMPATISSDGAIWTNTYNKRRLNERESLAYGGATYNISRAYDANGSQAQLTYPDGSALGYSPNALGEPQQVGAYATGITYHPNGAIAGFRYGNGVMHSLTQNQRGLPDTSIDTGALNDRYSYDQNGNVAAIADQYWGTNSRTMGYDGLDRLTSVSAPSLWGTSSYSYDALDNLTGNTITAGATARSVGFNYSDPATNRLMSVSGSTGYNFGYAYDSQGNITQRGGQQYTFDQGNRLTGAPGIATYRYDGLGHRVSVVGTDGVNRLQLYSQGGQILQAGPVGGAATRYVYLHNHVLAEVGPAGTQYQHTDALGSPVARTDGAGNVVSRTKYEPYGKTAQGDTPTLGFTGHVNDADTALVYMQQRYYDPVAGRFLSIDPVTADADTGTSFNRYSYASNSPYRYIDPDGRTEEPAIQVVTITAPRPAPVAATTIPNPNGVVPGGPWTPSNDPQPGKFNGPKQPPGCGPRLLCQYVPPASGGGPKGAEEGYWKTKDPGQKGWARYDLNGNPISPEEAHPGQGRPSATPAPGKPPVAAPAPAALPWLAKLSVFLILITASPDAN